MSERIRELQSIDWSAVGTLKSQLDCADVKEFLRNAAFVVRELGMSMPHPFCDVANLFDLSDRIPQVLTDLSHVEGIGRYPLAKRITVFYALTEYSQNAEVRSMYQPLISIFRRGGVVDLHHGELIVDNEWTLPLERWTERF